MKISLCITVLNEEKSIIRLLSSVFAGSKVPDEVIIVDGGSTDKTIDSILPIKRKYPIVKLVREKCGISKGRNLAIKTAMGNIIVQTDAGCVVKKDWLKKITQPFNDKKIDIVAGFYEMPAESPKQLAINVFHGIPPERFNEKTFIPSARSVAFRKAVWQKIGGYKEALINTAEDTLFFKNAVKKNFKIKRVGDARVIWEETRNMTLGQALSKFFNYAKGDAQSGIWWDPSKKFMSHNIKVTFIFVRYAIFLVLLCLWLITYSTSLLAILAILSVFYLIYPIYKWLDVVTDIKGIIWLPILQISSDLAVMSGFVSGILKLNELSKRHA